MKGNGPISRQAAELRSQVADIRPCVEGRVAERLETLIAGIEALAATAEGEIGREQAEAARFRGMIQELDGIVWVADAETGRYSFVSSHAEEVLGYPVDRWLADAGFWITYIHLDDREYVAANRRRCLEQGFRVEFEYRATTAAGRMVWFRELLRVAHGDGSVPELRGQMWDITRRKKVERQLYKAKDELARQLEDLRYLHEMSTRLSPMTELEPLLGEILSVVAATQGAEMSLIRLYDPATGKLRVATSLGFPDEYLSRVDPLPLGVMACGVAAETRSSVVVEDIETEPVYTPYRDLARLAGYRSAYCTPLISRFGDVLGTFATHFREPHRPPERQVRLVEVYARQAADFVENATHRRARVRKGQVEPDAPDPAADAGFYTDV